MAVKSLIRIIISAPSPEVPPSSQRDGMTDVDGRTGRIDTAIDA